MIFDTILNQWMATPIIISTQNANGKLWGDDTGYRAMRTLATNPAPLVKPELLIRGAYEGFSPYDGTYDPRSVLGGGLRDGAFVLREAAARSVSLAAQTLDKLSGGQFKLVGLDAFRSGLRQQLGYTTKLREQMTMIGLTDDDVNNNRRVAEFIGCSVRGDGVFSWVKVAKDGVYTALAAELMANDVGDGCRQYADANPKWGNVDDALYEYIIASRNAGIGLAATRGTLVWENNAHAGGGACDLMVVDSNDVLKAITPFDFPGHMSAYDYLETDANFDEYSAALETNEVLRNHLVACGYDPDNFTFGNWEYLRAVKRAQYHLFRAMNFSFYSMGHHGGEHWHEEPGNRVYDPFTGKIVWTESQTAAQYPDRGNPGHSLQYFGPNDIAVWGGATAHAIARDEFGLEI